MPEFKIDPVKALSIRRRARLYWGTELLLVAIVVLIFVLHFSCISAPMLPGLLMLTLGAAVVGAYVLAFREGLRRAERQMVFVLDDTGIARRRPGYPEVKIDFSQIETLREELRWLVIYSTEPRRKIAIPNDVKGYEEIRSELAKYHSLSSRMAPRAFPWRSTVLPTISVLSWAGVLFFRDMKALVPAAAVAITTMAVASRHLWSLHPKLKRSLFWISLGSAWLTTILVIYLRIRQL